MAIILPVYHRVRNVTLSAFNFATATDDKTVITSTANPVAGLDLGVATKPLTSGLLCGISVTLQDNTGPAASDYLVTIFSENSDDLAEFGDAGATGTVSVLYSATFSFSGVEKTISDMLSTPVPILAQPFIQVEQTTTATASNTILIKPYIQAIAN
tara:strand:- start:277 stop:744 length:468 start_codon:yes stop_codon:yes gene_type:complete